MISFDRYSPRNADWHRSARLLLDTLQREDLTRVQQVLFQRKMVAYLASVISAMAPAGTEFGNAQKASDQLYEVMTGLLHWIAPEDFQPETVQDVQKKQALKARKDWQTRYGDYADPATMQRIDRLEQALLNKARQAAETKLDFGQSIFSARTANRLSDLPRIM